MDFPDDFEITRLGRNQLIALIRQCEKAHNAAEHTTVCDGCGWACYLNDNEHPEECPICLERSITYKKLADEIQERALELEGSAVQLDNDPDAPLSEHSLQFVIRAEAKELRRLETELRKRVT